MGSLPSPFPKPPRPSCPQLHACRGFKRAGGKFKTFGKMNRVALWEVLRKCGMPDHLVSMPVRLCTGAVTSLKIGEEDTAVGSSIGVRQGACEGPILVLFITQAAPETVEWPVSKPTFRTRADGVTSGERLNLKRGVASFGPFASLFAGDCGIFPETAEDMVMGKFYLFNLRKFGLKMHVGSGTTAPKTEAMYYPASTGP